MSGQSNLPPVVIRRTIKVTPSHHGGAWKVAYADFVTAMMAFFLLMWLLNATTEKQRKGLSDYFNPTIVVSRTSAGGEDLLTGETALGANISPKLGTGGLDTDQTAEAAMQQLAVKLDRRLREIGGARQLLPQLMRHIVVRLSDEGVVIELYDSEEGPLFDGMGADLRPEAQALLQLIAEVLSLTRNRLAINAHLRQTPMLRQQQLLWNISTARALATQRKLQDFGLEDIRFQRLVAFADRKPAHRDPQISRNNRIEIVLLRPEA